MNMVASPIRSKWNYDGLHVSKPFGLVRVEGDQLVTWITVPLLWRAGIRWSEHRHTIDTERPVYLSRPMASLYVPLGGGKMIRTSIGGVEQQIRAAGLSIEIGTP